MEMNQKTEQRNEIRKRFSDLAKILEHHHIAWTYDLLIDLDMYIASESRKSHDNPARVQ